MDGYVFGSNFDDVGKFHRRFGLPTSTEVMAPHLLEPDVQEFRENFLQEELNEFAEAHAEGDLGGAADALIDLVYVALGTAHLMHLPWQRLWDEVQRANMEKVRAPDAKSSKRHHHFDVIKPEGWVPPDIDGVLEKAGANFS